MGIQLADPLPAFCSACHNAKPDQRYVDFGVAHDAGAFVNGSNAYVASQDELAVCEACMREGLELLELRPQLHERQRQEIRRLAIELEHWKDVARRGLKDLNEQISAQFGEPKKRKAAA